MPPGVPSPLATQMLQQGSSSAPSSPSKAAPVSPIAAMARPIAGAPLDYSFQGLKQVTDLLHVTATSGNPRCPPLEHGIDDAEYLDGLAAAAEEGSSNGHSTSRPSLSRSHPGVLYNSNALRLANNQLMSLSNLHRVLGHLMDDSLELVWLDASCNQLTSIEDVILRFPKLQVLYLHGNKLTNLHDILKLAEGLPHLVKLTLHGTPLAEYNNYKMWVIAHLPHLRSLDFSSITRLDRDKTDTWLRGWQKTHGKQ